MPKGKYVVNDRILHSVVCSGMLPVHYKRFAHGAGIGHITDKQQSDHFSLYKEAVSEEYSESVATALQHEISGYDIDDHWQGINIMTDARHGWRKNAKDSSVVAIGEQSHQVIQHVHVTKHDDHCSQRHERLETQKVYDYLDGQSVSVAVHAHDRNTSINKLVRDSQPATISQNDTWHSVKALKKAVAKIGAGPKYMKGKSWHWQLEDKADHVATHAHWAIRNCGQCADTLKSSLTNIVKHYQNQHDHCCPLSRCKRDPGYEPSRVVITEPSAVKLLESTIKKSVLFTSPLDYILAKDTFLVESFNNTMTIFHDKRIAFGDEQYLSRSHLAVCHWNENVDRGYTSVWHPKHDPKAPRRKRGKKVLKPCS